MENKSKFGVKNDKKNTDSGSQNYCQEWCEGLLKKHGDKILNEPSGEWTDEEIVDHYLYKLFSRGINGQRLTASIILEERNKLVAKYGNKIYDKPTSNWNQGELAAHNLYKAYSDLLHDLAPDLKKLDPLYEFFDKNEIDSPLGWLRFFSRHIKKLFWLVFLVAGFLAVIKYLLQ